jgi:preprotein translocase subunit YajC
MVMYNMASFLGSIAAGFDVRMANIGPQPVAHPKLEAHEKLKDDFDPKMMRNSPKMYKEIYNHERDIMNVGNPSLNRLYGLQTYHGPTSKHKIRSSLNQLPVFQQQNQQQQQQQQHQNHRNNYFQSTTLTTTSGLGSNFTSYTTDPIDSSLGSSNNSENHNHQNKKNERRNDMRAGTSSSTFLESDIGTNDEYLYLPEENHQLMSPQRRIIMNYDGGKLKSFVFKFIIKLKFLILHRFLHSCSTFQYESISSSTSCICKFWS